jgi:NADPH-dependent 2,4-dienoyl-CoA reductase/sulfur reductase-like enzyme
VSERTVVVGASIGGVRTAQALRRGGYAGEVVLVDAEAEPPYDRPPLSKAMLLGAMPPTPTLLTRDEAGASDIRLELGVAAQALDIAGGTVALADGRRLAFDDVVLATGSVARPSPWGRPQGLHVLRTLADARALRADLRRAGRLVVVGAGFIGAEVASAATALGLSVSVVDPLPVPMGRVVGDEVGRVFERLHRRHGVSTHFGRGVEDVRRESGGLSVTLTDGTRLDADLVVVGIGAVPNQGWLESSGLLLDDGVVCDEFCRAVGQPRVHVVGDLARWHHRRHGELVRVEHWTNAVEQASCVAHNIGNPEALRACAPVEYVWSDQYDWKIQLAGRPWRGMRWEMLGDPDVDQRFAVLWADEAGVLCGAMSVNWPKATVASRRALGAAGATGTLEEVREGLTAARAGATAR